MIKINLLSEGKRPTAVRRAKATGGRLFRSEDLAKWLFAGALLLLIAGFGVYWWMLHSELGRTQDQIADVNDELKELAPIIKEVADFKAKKAALEHQIQVISDLKANQRGPVRILDEVSRGLPELLWLTRLDMTANNVSISGETFSTNAVAAFIENLGRVPEFQEPRRTQVTSEKDIYNFSLQFGYRPVTQANPLPETVPPTSPTGTEAGAAPAAGPATALGTGSQSR